jgi:hydrogenase large subunit
MATTVTIDPVTRIEGHLRIEVTIETVKGRQQVIGAKSSGTMFRGFERILLNHDPFDAPHFTQRICGVCPTSHGMASCMAIEKAYKKVPPNNGRILRNLVLGADFIQSHILHFYHLAALDYINTKGILDMAPWTSRYLTDDMVKGTTAKTLVDHYVQALEIRRKAHQMGAIFGGKLPCSSSFAPGGCTEVYSQQKRTDFMNLLSEIRRFINNVYIPDVEAVAGIFDPYFDIGYGCGNLLAYGVFELDSTGNKKLLRQGRIEKGSTNVLTLDQTKISEDVKHSWYSSPTALHPSAGQTTPDAARSGAYSWIKSPRYNRKVYEVGPLARMWVSGDYQGGISVMDRLAARAYEAKIIADAMILWLGQLASSGASYSSPVKASSASGIGLTEAPRGALGHWMSISSSVISRYQVVTPTAWNASPMDDLGQNGPIEQALIGTPVKDITKPVEVLRVIHSFDPCLACSVHMLRPDKEKVYTVIQTPSGL